MEPKENKTLVRRYFEDIRNRDLSTVEALLTPGIVFENPPGRIGLFSRCRCRPSSSSTLLLERTDFLDR